MTARALRRVVVVGGTGAFGERLVRGFVGHSDFAVTVAARDLARAEALAARLGGAPRVVAARFDSRTVDATHLRGLGAFALVDAAGPFQGSALPLAGLCIAAGLHYVDLADSRDAVEAIAGFDDAARAAGIVALSGASSTPALSQAALHRLTCGWQRIDRVEIALAPGNRAPRGLSVMRSILSYAGRPVRVFLDGQWQERPGWSMTQRRVIGSLGPRYLALCDTPDLDLLPRRFGVRQSAVFRAGLELPLLHLGLLALSLPVRVMPALSLAPLAPTLRVLADLFARLGTDRGGMMVEAEGLDAAGRPARSAWIVEAEAGDGPVIPTLPALAALRLIAAGALVPGARMAAGEIPLHAIAAEFAPYRIAARVEAGA